MHFLYIFSFIFTIYHILHNVNTFRNIFVLPFVLSLYYKITDIKYILSASEFYIKLKKGGMIMPEKRIAQYKQIENDLLQKTILDITKRMI